MRPGLSQPVRGGLIWAAVLTAIAVPTGLAMASPLLAWREPVYILSGFAGIAALALLLLQPLLAAGLLPGVRGRVIHRWTGAALVLCVVTHVAGLWITSPPDVVDALLLVSPTPFSLWGVIAMWAVFATAVLALLRARMRIRNWRRAHIALAVVIVAGTVLHSLLIDGTMETVSKAVLCAAVLAATLKVGLDRRWLFRRARGRDAGRTDQV